MKKTKLNLYFEESLIGSLVEGAQHFIEFTYDPSWFKSDKSFSISMSLPLREETYTREAHSFFANLLPEGSVRDAVASSLGVSSENDFRLLEALGGECAGALTVGHSPKVLESSYHELSVKKLREIYESGDMVFSSVQGEAEGIRLSLAGAQDKIPVFYETGRLYLPHGNSPSSHILKPPSKRFKHLPENEYLMGKLAQAMGLEVASSQLIDFDGVKAYLVERYDRKKVGKKIVRLHQEDFCQALSYSYKAKYQKDGGPSFKDCYACTEGHSDQLPEDLERLVKWLIFNILTGNCDAHAKNISFLMTGPDEWRLSPHYDLVSTKAYPKLSTKLAMAVGGSADSGTITGTHWSRLAKDIQMGQKWIHQTVNQMAETSEELFKKISGEFLDTYGKSPIVKDLEGVLGTQSRRLLSLLEK